MRKGRRAGRDAKMPLTVEIEKKLAAFALNLSFTADDAPLSILGASGAGKTMLLRCIAGLERPNRGRIVLGQRILLDSERRIRMPARDRRVGMLFQNYALFPHRTVEENVRFGLSGAARESADQRVSEVLARTHAAGFERRYPRQLSGGEQQRVALARALAIEPEALLLDEPLSALDTQLRSQMEAQLQETFSTYKRPALLVTHNIEEAYRLSKKLLVLSRGQIAAYGDREEVFARPPSTEVARLTGCKNFSRARASSENAVEAIDWGCQLRISQPISKNVEHVGVRAHHIDFVEASERKRTEQNIFPCWLVRSSETPFRITLYLRLGKPPDESGSHDLQAEVFKEKWDRFREKPQPWHVELPPESLFVMAE